MRSCRLLLLLLLLLFFLPPLLLLQQRDRGVGLRPAASDVIDEDAAFIGVPSFCATGASDMGTRYYFVEVCYPLPSRTDESRDTHEQGPLQSFFQRTSVVFPVSR